MTLVTGVRFKDGGKVYYFAPGELELTVGTKVIVETAQGTEIGDVAINSKEVDDSAIHHPLKSVLRIANKSDLKRYEKNCQKEKEALAICEEAVKKCGLEMKLVDVDYSFDGSKILFYFTADGRVDFRELVKVLAARFKTRIELRQIGVRDEAKMQGGLGSCGQEFCCRRFLGDFIPVSIKMAKEQGLSLNPTKISGACGRLMCCLKYEQEAYADMIKDTPGVGSYVETPEFRGYVTEVNLLKGTLKVRREDDANSSPHIFSKNDIKVLRGSAFVNDSPDDDKDIIEE